MWKPPAWTEIVDNCIPVGIFDLVVFLGWLIRCGPVWTECAENASDWRQECSARRQWVCRI